VRNLCSSHNPFIFNAPSGAVSPHDVAPLVSGGLPTRRYGVGKTEEFFSSSATVERNQEMKIVVTLALIVTFSPRRRTSVRLSLV
jgi:hypothetical protein